MIPLGRVLHTLENYTNSQNLKDATRHLSATVFYVVILYRQLARSCLYPILILSKYNSSHSKGPWDVHVLFVSCCYLCYDSYESTIIYDNLRMLCVWFCMLFHSVSVPCRPVDSTLTPPRNFWPWTLTTPGSLRVLYCIVWFWSVWDFEADLIEVWRVWNGIVVELERWFWKDSGPSFTRKQAKDWGRNAHACACSWTLVACCASCTWHSEHAACP